jgi:hypothetical protein
MTNPERIGIEPRKDRQLIARVESTDNQDDCLAEFLAANAVTAVNADTPVTISVSDAEVAVKLLSLPPDSAHDFRSRVIFELTQSVLEPPEQFMFDAHRTSIASRYLGLVYRREPMQALQSRLLSTRNGSLPAPQYLMRAVALGRGYERFAVSDGDGLLCLADLVDSSVSLCFLHNRNIVSVAYMSASELKADDPKSIQAFGVDLKSLINYQVANCAQHGLSVPLSAMVMCGMLSNPELHETLSPLFSSRVVAPQVRADRVNLLLPDSSIRFADCIAALGLTVN